MTRIENPRGIALSLGAVANGWPNPMPARARIHREGGDYAETSAGRMRRAMRRDRIAFKRSGLEG